MPPPDGRRCEGRGPHASLGPLLLVVLLAAVGASAATCGRDVSSVVASGDGLGLRLALDGRVSGVAVGGRPVAMAPGRGGFSIRRAGGRPNLLANGGLEGDADRDGAPDGWSLERQAVAPAPDASVSRSGRWSVRIATRARATSGSLQSLVPVTPDSRYFLSAWIKSAKVRPSATTAGPSPVRLEVRQLASGALTETSRAYGYTDTAGWHRRVLGFKTGPGVRKVLIKAFLARGSGSVWFDDFRLSELLEPEAREISFVTEDEARNLLTQRASLTRDGLLLSATYRGARDHIRVDGSISSTDREDKAFQLTYTLPVDATGWRWGEYARASKEISRGSHSYEGSHRLPRAPGHASTELQQTSRYPFGVIYGDGAGIGLGIPLDRPRISRLAYDRRGFSITFDLGISLDADKIGRKASFSFVIYRFDPSWGFRAATKKYYRVFPRFFTRRIPPRRQGIWFVAPPLRSLTGAKEDFGLGLNVIALGKAPSQSHGRWGRRYLLWADDHGVTSSAYTHQWAFYLPRQRASLPSYPAVVKRLRAAAASKRPGAKSERWRDEAAATLSSGQRDVNGRLYYERYGRFLAFYQNLDRGGSARWARAVNEHQVERALDVAAAAGGVLDGIHLDSTSGMRRWAAVDDYSRKNWSAAEMPLTFSYDSGGVTQRGIFGMYAQMRRLAAFLHRRRMILSSNFNAGEARAGGYIGADQIDFFGVEGGLPERGTIPGVDTNADRFAMLKRTLAYHRPVSTLDTHIAGTNVGIRDVTRRLQQNLFYGIFPGAWRGPAEADDHQKEATWSRPDRRAVYARYTPLFRALAAAGWEPVTRARSSNPRVWVERFGSLRKGDLHLTLRNETARRQDYELQIELRRQDDAGLEALELVSHRRLGVRMGASQTVAVVSGRIAPVSTQVIKVAAA